jgi:hypothetical protein
MSKTVRIHRWTGLAQCEAHLFRQLRTRCGLRPLIVSTMPLVTRSTPSNPSGVAGPLP